MHVPFAISLDTINDAIQAFFKFLQEGCIHRTSQRRTIADQNSSMVEAILNFSSIFDHLKKV